MGRAIVPAEKDVQLAICDYLAYRKCMYWRQNTTGMYDAGKQVFRKLPKYAKAGVPDIIVIKNGHFIGIEVKKKGGKQSENQVKFQKELEANGGKYFLVTNVTDVINIGL